MCHSYDVGSQGGIVDRLYGGATGQGKLRLNLIEFVSVLPVATVLNDRI